MSSPQAGVKKLEQLDKKLVDAGGNSRLAFVTGDVLMEGEKFIASLDEKVRHILYAWEICDSAEECSVRGRVDLVR